MADEEELDEDTAELLAKGAIDESDIVDPKPKKPAPIPEDMAEPSSQDGPSGRDFRRRFPQPDPMWAKQGYPNFRPKAELVDVSGENYQRPYLEHMPDQSPQAAAILKVIEMSKPGGQRNFDPFTDMGGHVPAHYMPAGQQYTQLEKDIGLEDFDKFYKGYPAEQGGKFIMPTDARDDYLADVEYSTAMGRPVGPYDPDEMARKHIESMSLGTPGGAEAPDDIWEGDKTPTQTDVDTLKEDPSNEMVMMFEKQFGDGSADKYIKVPTPKPRPKKAK